MKRKYIHLTILLVIFLTFFKIESCASEKSTYYMTVNEKKSIPISFYNGNYNYHSTNPKVIQFTEDGKMIAKKSGSSNIILTHYESNGEKYIKTYKVKVHEKVKKLKWESKYNEIEVGEKVKFKVKYKSKNKKNIELQWKSSNPTVATVDKNGNVNGISKGNAVISCSVKGQKKAKITNAIKVRFIPVTSINIEKDTLKLKMGMNYNLSEHIDVQPVNATNSILSITTSNDNVVRVVNGILYAVGKGTAEINISSIDGSKCNKIINVFVDDYLFRTDAKFIAHRGLSGIAPENTMRAFELACDNGFYGIETDIWLSKDEEFVISHDSNLYRTCGVNLEISDLTFKEIQSQKIKFGNNYSIYSNDNKATQIPSLKEYLILCKNRNVIPMIEVKFPNVSDSEDDMRILNKLYKEIQSVMGEEFVYLISFHYKFINNMNTILRENNCNNIELRLLIDIYKDTASIPIYDYCNVNKIGFSMRKENEDALIEKVISELNSVGIWTINDRDEAKKYLNMGIDFIVTDEIIWDEE